MKVYQASTLNESRERATSNGWELKPNGDLVRITYRSRNIALRMLWPLDVYPVIETLTFTGGGRIVPPVCMHAVSDAPWKAYRATRVTFRKAVSLMDQPLEESPVHQYRV